ncbi:hypothetical protein [Spectribacter hydrogenoxidans]|uniref:Uncharacterized protein n=1 Tax=Spectribacter hydrogenoxidans TaxID=3075608 RepID=A0ABU3C0H8_9GAMM|nr:hypothetical protein [Salinisphaera sp. W335]MDT0635068.1 hypothetical protein [Salinisphaera sp. W335]
MSGLKRNDIQPCALCHKGLMAGNQIAGYRVKIDHMLFDPGAIQRAHGLEMMMGGHVALATALGPDEALAQEVSSSTALICQACALETRVSLAEVFERMGTASESGERSDDN